MPPGLNAQIPLLSRSCFLNSCHAYTEISPALEPNASKGQLEEPQQRTRPTRNSDSRRSCMSERRATFPDAAQLGADSGQKRKRNTTHDRPVGEPMRKCQKPAVLPCPIAIDKPAQLSVRSSESKYHMTMLEQVFDNNQIFVELQNIMKAHRKMDSSTTCINYAGSMIVESLDLWNNRALA